ncbi:hypothetical protein BG011_003218 [Mortierella polycephala]|uniref:Tetraspanin Tsp2 n=1 Tax=Mortierella polycephala TaxID=41804 RepID=A0A9P6U376_9FUNG|nr:hypothetical protein BG011_003218 [Mortierella polycephala]
MRPPHGTALTTSTVGSFDARARSIASHQSSDQNLAHGNDAQYNLTQNDLTLEGLEERWQAYQAWWAKQYKEQPFYRLWTRSKWLLLLSVLMLLTYSCAAFAVALGYMLGRFEYSVVVMEFHGNIISSSRDTIDKSLTDDLTLSIKSFVVATAASACGILSALVGLIGIFKEDRIWLSWYNVMLWPVFTLYISVGYIAFRRIKNQLRAHLKDEWVHSYTREQRLLVQRNLKCCGYRSSSSHGEYDLRCFPLISLPGCEHKYNLYEHRILTTCWTASFSLVPFLLFAMVVALLCSNHVDGMLRSGRPGLKSFKSSKEQ